MVCPLFCLSFLICSRSLVAKTRSMNKILRGSWGKDHTDNKVGRSPALGVVLSQSGVLTMPITGTLPLLSPFETIDKIKQH